MFLTRRPAPMHTVPVKLCMMARQGFAERERAFLTPRAFADRLTPKETIPTK
jgi:hypothetical protein